MSILQQPEQQMQAPSFLDAMAIIKESSERQQIRQLEAFIDEQHKTIVDLTSWVIQLMDKTNPAECRVCGSDKNVWFRTFAKQHVCDTCWQPVKDVYERKSV